MVGGSTRPPAERGGGGAHYVDPLKKLEKLKIFLFEGIKWERPKMGQLLFIKSHGTVLGLTHKFSIYSSRLND